jgi:hypothetical protein
MAARKLKSAISAIVMAGADAAYIAQGMTAAYTDKDTAQAKADGFAKQGAEYLDSIAPNWTQVKHSYKTPEGQRAKFAEQGIEPDQEGLIMQWRAGFLATIKAARPDDTGQAWQNVTRWSVGYTGARPAHPEAKAKQEADKASKASKEKVAGERESATTEVNIADFVASDPQNARLVLSQVIAGLTDNIGARKKNKVNVTHLVEALDAIKDACESIAADKAGKAK